MDRIISLVPGDDWLETLTVLQQDGSPANYAGWTIIVSNIKWPKGSIEITVDTSQAATGVFGLSAANAATGVLPYGPASDFCLQGQSPAGKKETIYFGQVVGVRVKALNSLTITHVGTQGPAGLDWRDDVNDGDWLAGTPYQVSDAVFHDPSSFRAIIAHTADADTEPELGDDWRNVWRYVAKGGGRPAPPPVGALDFSQTQNSGLLALLEDI